MSTHDERHVSDLMRRWAIAEEKLKTHKPPDDRIPDFSAADVFAELSFLRSADRYFAYVRLNTMDGLYGGDAIAMHVKDGFATRTLLLDDCEGSLLKDTQPMSICDVNLIVDTARDAGFFDQPDILKPCSFNSPEDWYGIRDHVGRSKWIKVPTGVSHAAILMVLLDLLWAHVPECLNKIFSRFDDEDDFDDAEEAGDEPENRITPDA